jgi:glutathione S-transferase
MMRLYTGAESGNSWKVRILLEQLEIPYEKIYIDLLTWEHKKKEFISTLNPRGQVPVLVDGDKHFWDSTACMVYLARKMNRADWLPLEPEKMAEVMHWIALAHCEIHFGLQYGRRGVMRDRWVIGTASNLPEYQKFGLAAMRTMEWRLAEHDWLAAPHITIADIACFPYVLNSPEAGLPHDEFPGIQRWLARCLAMPRWAEPPRAPTRNYPDMPVDEE